MALIKKIIKHKKAITTQIIIHIILGLASLLLLLLLFSAMRDKSENYLGKETCKRSVETISFSKLRIAGFQVIDKIGNKDALKCTTEYITVPIGKEKQYIANAMYDCWDMFGQGKKEVFDTATGNYCVICSRLEFKEKGSVNEITNYLIENKVPGKDITYFKYLNDVEMQDKEIIKEYENSNLASTDTIDTTKPVAIIFIMSKKPSDERWKGSAIGAIAGGTITTAGVLALPISAGTSTILIAGGISAIGGGTIGYFAGSNYGNTYWSSTILIWPYDNLKELNKCTVLEGKTTPLRTATYG